MLTFLDLESIALSSSDGKSRPKPKSSKKHGESAAEAETAGAAALDEKDVSSVIGAENTTVSDDDSQASANLPPCDGGKQLDLFGMTICDTSDESRDATAEGVEVANGAHSRGSLAATGAEHEP